MCRSLKNNLNKKGSQTDADKTHVNLQCVSFKIRKITRRYLKVLLKAYPKLRTEHFNLL